MTDQTPKRITIDAPSEATILAARHLDATEGRAQVGSTVDTATRSAITTVLDYIAKAHNTRAAIPTRDEVSRYDRLSPIARALVDDYAAPDLAEMLVKAQDELAALRIIARGYCPDCGRGDAAPTVADWEQQKQRAETAERERDIARQHASAIAAQRDRLRQRMNTLADRWDHALAPDKPYARTLRAEITCAPFDPDGAMAVREYTERGRRLWAFRCWGTDTCDGWLGLGHHTQTSALAERERHVAEAHTAPALDAPLRDQLRAAIKSLAASETILARIQALADEYPAGIDTALIHEALDTTTLTPAATEATDTQKEN